MVLKLMKERSLSIPDLTSNNKIENIFMCSWSAIHFNISIWLLKHIVHLLFLIEQILECWNYSDTNLNQMCQRKSRNLVLKSIRWKLWDSSFFQFFCEVLSWTHMDCFNFFRNMTYMFNQKRINCKLNAKKISIVALSTVAIVVLLVIASQITVNPTVIYYAYEINRVNYDESANCIGRAPSSGCSYRDASIDASFNRTIQYVCTE